ncbi:MAG TPA: hypothetical protein VK631_23710 [Solirubrobacteraceae bacterium]|nr:hypothetical protein [Solirubrobacteraceae bacterium]
MHDRSTSRPGGRGPGRWRLASLGLLVTVGVLAAGCGGDPAGGAGPAVDRDSEAREASLKYAQCMREQGIDMPDPIFEDGGTRQRGPDRDVPPAKLKEADQACDKHKPESEWPEFSEEEQEEFEEAALANARCMREQGIENYPDPTFGENGEATIRFRVGSGLDPEDPDFREAEEACKDTRPKPPSEESAR